MRRGVLAAVACAMALGGFSKEQATHFAQDAWEPFLKTGGNCYASRERNAQAAEKFFKTRIDRSGVEAYTGRLK